LIPLPLDSCPSDELDRSLDELLEDELLEGGELDVGGLLLGGGPLDDGGGGALLDGELLVASLLVDGVPLDDGALLSPEDDGADELDGALEEDESLSLEPLDEKLSLEEDGDDELDGRDELGVDDDGVLGVELLEDGAELDGPLLLDNELDELPLLELLLSELLDELEQQSQQQQPAWWLCCHEPSDLVSVQCSILIVTSRL
jgi:hypothetical protein